VSASDDGLLDYWFEREPSASLEPGRLSWAPVTFVESRYFEATIASQSPSDDLATTFKVADYDASGEAARHPPVKFLGLRSDDQLRLARFKRRPVVIASSENARWKDEQGAVRQESKRTRLVVPIYTAERYGSTFVQRVRRFSYNTHFWLPANTERGGKPDRDTIVRFDGLETLHERWIEPIAWRLNDEAFAYLRAWLDYFLDGRHNPTSKTLNDVYAS
jgi:hypothetical protein